MNSMRTIMSNNKISKTKTEHKRTENNTKSKEQNKRKKKRKTYLNIFNIEIVQKMLGQFEPTQLVVDGCETFFIL